MKRNSFFAGLAALLLPLGFALAQEPKTPVYPPDAATMTAIHQKITELKAATEQLQKMEGFTASPPLTRPQRGFQWNSMVDVFLKAADWTLRNNEFWQKDSGKQILAVLDEGLRRARDFPNFRKSLSKLGGRTLACGYHSNVDGSTQPYVVSFPVDFGKDPKKKWRLDIVLHGRDNTLTEVKMLAAALRRGSVKPEQDFIQLEVYGRGNNAYRWAGETDVLDAFYALSDLGRQLSGDAADSLIDESRIVLRGFSMGGAGTWHLGLHLPDRWCVIGPGAGFTNTHGYIKNLPAELADYQEACLRIYDAVDYAENASMVPVVAYAGDKDPQQQAAINIENTLKPLGIPMTRLVGTGLAHQFPAEWQKKAQEAYAPFVKRGSREEVNKVHFVTYTLSYPFCREFIIRELDRHYTRTVVDAVSTEKGYEIKTANVRTLNLLVRPKHQTQSKLILHIDEQNLVLTRPKKPDPIFLESFELVKQAGKWQEVKNYKTSRKSWFSHGPIDDAFRAQFVCVRGTGTCWNPQVQVYTDAALNRFQREWELYFRGQLPIVTDKEFLAAAAARPVSSEPGFLSGDLRYKSLILFGDPASNPVIASLMAGDRPDLPLRWDANEISMGGRKYSAKTHVPALIYPNPKWSSPYVVLNSGHTFHEADLQGTNALLYPRLGDFAILKPTPTAKDPASAEVVRAGLFDDDWKVPAEK